MALPEQPPRGGQPEKNNASQELLIAQSPDIAPLLKERLGRLVGVDTQQGIKIVGYALPREINYQTKRVTKALFMVPDGRSTRYCILDPKYSYVKDERIQKAENESYRATLEDMVTPSPEPFIISSWIPQPSKHDFDSIAPTVGYFATFMRIDPKNVETERQKAIAAAKVFKRENVAINDTAMLDRLGAEVVTDLGQLDRKWEEMKRQRASEQSIFDAKFAAMVDIFGSEFNDPDEGRAA